MGIDTARITREINALWDTWAPLLLFTAALLALIVVWLAGRTTVRAVRALIRRGAKATIGFGVVQAGVAFAVITGVYEFFHRRMSMPTVEAAILAVFIEAAVWGAVGLIVIHAKSGKPGFGDAGAFLVFAQVGGGALAVLGADSTAVAIGRVIIVGFGAYMWYLQLLQVVTRVGKRSRWRWTPRRLLLAVGAMTPEDGDVEDEHREWAVRRLARSVRWANSRGPLSQLGSWTLTRRAEQANEEVLAEGRRRAAAVHVLKDQCRMDSPTMTAVIAAVEATLTRTATSGHVTGQDTSGVRSPADRTRALPAGGQDTTTGRPDTGQDMSRTSDTAPGWTGPVNVPDTWPDMTPDMTPDTRPDTRPDMTPDMTPDTRPDTSRIMSRTPNTRADRTRVNGRRTPVSGQRPALPVGMSDRQQQVVTLIRQEPDISQEEISALLNVSSKTVQRAVRELRDQHGADTFAALKVVLAGQDTGQDTRPDRTRDRTGHTTGPDTQPDLTHDRTGQPPTHVRDTGQAMTGHNERTQL